MKLVIVCKNREVDYAYFVTSAYRKHNGIQQLRIRERNRPEAQKTYA